MRALWIAPYLFYPLRAGGQFSIYPWLKELASRGWDIFLIQYNSPPGLLRESLEGLSWARGVLTVEPRRFRDRKSYIRELVLSQVSFFRLRNDVPEIYGALGSVRDFDPQLIVLSHSYMGFLIPVLRELFPRSKVLIDLHNLEWRAYANFLNIDSPFLDRADALLNFIRLKEEEKRALMDCDGVTFLSPLEGKYVKLFGKPMLWRPARFPESRIISEEELVRNKDIIITSSLNLNLTCIEILSFIKDVWVKYRELFKGANFWILGREPLDWFVKEASKSAGVKVLGWVEDPSPYIRMARVFVAPFKKTMGSLTKIVSAWSWGVPVVTTSLVAKGLRAEPGRHLLVGDNSEEILSSCLKVAMDDDLALRLSSDSYSFVMREYSLESFVNNFERWIREGLL